MPNQWEEEFDKRFTFGGFIKCPVKGCGDASCGAESILNFIRELLKEAREEGYHCSCISFQTNSDCNLHGIEGLVQQIVKQERERIIGVIDGMMKKRELVNVGTTAMRDKNTPYNAALEELKSNLQKNI